MSDIVALEAAVHPGTWPEARTAQRAAAASVPVDAWWSGGEAPMPIVQGRYDVIAPAKNGIALQEEFPDRARLVWVEEAGHMMLVEQPADVAAHVVAFLRDHSGY